MQNLREEELGALVFRVVEEFLGRVLFNQLAKIEKDDPVATSRAKPISWATTIIVMPLRANSCITSSTSLIISGSMCWAV